ncbi:hypothetical protein [Amycolatopsis sp. A1MSW2902]|uniref:hypothetical protein n=1 Tax=Amycolatopsis sp. A1MSW2902 TaxID=687413 RepID=UPI00307E95ED
MTVFDDFADLGLDGLLQDWRGDVESEPFAPGLDVRSMRLRWSGRRDGDVSGARCGPGRLSA